MGCLTTTTTILACLPENSPSTPHAPRVRRINGAPPPTPRTQRKRQPSVAEVQKAIGAGMYGDNNSRGKGGDSNFLDMISSGPFAQPEGPAERQLREIGEWFVDRAERGPRSGQHILMVLCLTILPVWILLFMVAAGLIQLPFNVPFLDDFFM